MHIYKFKYFQLKTAFVFVTYIMACGTGIFVMGELRKIFICDDNEDILEVVSVLMKRAGYAVKGVTSYKELLPMLEQELPDLLICDIRMPERDGFWIAEHIQSKNLSIPIIFMTAYDSNLYRTYAPFVGSVGFITKPIDSAALISQVREALKPKIPTDPQPKNGSDDLVPLPK